MTGIKNKISAFGFPRLIIMAFLGLLIVLMFLMDIPAPLTFSQCIVRVGINMVLGLAMVPGIMDRVSITGCLGQDRASPVLSDIRSRKLFDSVFFL